MSSEKKDYKLDVIAENLRKAREAETEARIEEESSDLPSEEQLLAQIAARTRELGGEDVAPKQEKSSMRQTLSRAGNAAFDALAGLSPEGSEDRAYYEKTRRDWEAGAPKKEKNETALGRAAGMLRAAFGKAAEKFGAVAAARAEAYARIGREYADREVVPEGAFAKRPAKDTAESTFERKSEAPVEQNDYEDFKARFEKDHAKDGLGRLIGSMENTIPGFADMTPGARMLAVEALTNRLYAEVKDRGEKMLASKLAPADISRAPGMLGAVRHYGSRALDAAKKTVRYGLWKNYRTSKYERAAYESLTTDELDAFVAEHAGIARTLADKNLDVRLHADGKTVLVDYVGQSLESGSSEAIANEFNRRAKRVQNIPKEWTYADAKPADRKKYLAALAALEAVEPAMLGVMKERFGGDEAKAAIEMAKARRTIDAMSFLSQNPEASDALRSIGTRTEGGRIARAVAKYWTDRYSGDNLRYAALGAVGRFVSGTVLAGLPVIGLPVAVAISNRIAYYRGKDAAREGFRKEGALARMGGAAKSETRQVMSRADLKLRDLKNLTEQLAQSFAPNGGAVMNVAQVRNKLETHLAYITEKFKRGEINYGSEKERFAVQYDLMMAMHAAEAELAAADVKGPNLLSLYTEAVSYDGSKPLFFAGQNHDSSDRRRRSLLEARGEMYQKMVAEAREKKMEWQAHRSAVIGGLMGSVGFYFSDLMHRQPETLDAFRHIDTEAAVPPVPVVAPRYSSVEDIISHSVAHADASVKGAEDMLLAIKRSPEFSNLTPAQQEFFNANTLHAVAKEARLYDDASGSVIIPKGSSIEIADNGHMYLVDRARGETHDLGLLDKKTGVFTPADEPGLAHSATEAASAAPQRPKITLEKPDDAPETITEKPTPEDIGLPKPSHDETMRFQEAAAGEQVSPRAEFAPDDDTEAAVSFNRTAEYTQWDEYDPSRMFTESQMSRVMHRAARKYNHQVNRFFGDHDVIGQLIVPGEDMLLWKETMQKLTAEQFFALRRNQVPIYHYQQFFRHIAKLSERFPDVPREMPFPAYMKELYRREAIEHVASVDE